MLRILGESEVEPSGVFDASSFFTETKDFHFSLKAKKEEDRSGSFPVITVAVETVRRLGLDTGER